MLKEKARVRITAIDFNSRKGWKLYHNEDLYGNTEIAEWIFISGNVPSSKNSKRWTGKRLINSETVMKYKKNTADEWWQEGIKFREMLKGKKKPYKIGFYFIRNSKRAFDYVNVAQLPLDLMQENEWIENDNMENVIPVFLGYEVDKRNAGVRIEIL